MLIRWISHHPCRRKVPCDPVSALCTSDWRWYDALHTLNTNNIVHTSTALVDALLCMFVIPHSKREPSIRRGRGDSCFHFIWRVPPLEMLLPLPHPVCRLLWSHPPRTLFCFASQWALTRGLCDVWPTFPGSWVSQPHREKSGPEIIHIVIYSLYDIYSLWSGTTLLVVWWHQQTWVLSSRWGC